MSQKNSDGPRSSGGHRFGYRSAAAAGPPMGWVLRQRSPEQVERDARNAELDARLSALFLRFPPLSGFRQDEYGRTSPGWLLVRDPGFLAAVEAALAAEAVRDEKERRLRDRRRVLEAAVASGHYKRSVSA